MRTIIKISFFACYFAIHMVHGMDGLRGFRENSFFIDAEERRSIERTQCLNVLHEAIKHTNYLRITAQQLTEEKQKHYLQDLDNDQLIDSFFEQLRTEIQQAYDDDLLGAIRKKLGICSTKVCFKRRILDELLKS